MEKSLQLQDLKVSNLPELQGWKEKQQQLVADNPYVEIVDNKTYDIACKSRTALLKGRTELERQDKVIASQLTSFRKEVKSETDNLIAITLPHEEKQQSEVKRYEATKEAEKAEKERLEQERVDCIKNRIDNCESECYRIIQDTTIDNVELHKTMLDAFVNADFDYEEFYILFEQSKDRIQSSWDMKCNDIQEKEAQRVENERLQKEAEEAKRVAELQNTRLNYLKPFLSYCSDVDLTQLSELSEFDFNALLAEKTSLHDADVVAKKETDAKIESDNQKIFEIRKSRLEEIGFVLNDDRDGFFWSLNGVEKVAIRIGQIKDADVIDFETIITDSKLAIEKAKEEAEKAEQQRLADEKLAKEDAEKLKKENKAREKRLAKDKEIYKKTLNESLSGFPMFFDSPNEEIKSFSIECSNKVGDLLRELLTELENL